MTLDIQQYAVGPMKNFTYLLGDSEEKVAALIDPGWEGERLVREIESRGYQLVAILLTHTHFDHIRAVPEVLALRKVPVYVHTLERMNLNLAREVHEVHETEEGSEIVIGKLRITCHHTPGHSPGGQCFEVGKILITGDTLFVDACGRVDLPGSDSQAMKQSLQRLALFPDDTVISPGHDYGPTPTSTLGAQKKSNPHLR